VAGLTKPGTLSRPPGKNAPSRSVDGDNFPSAIGMPAGGTVGLFLLAADNHLLQKLTVT